jgi:hypothetical protein
MNFKIQDMSEVELDTKKKGQPQQNNLKENNSKEEP